MLNNYTKHFYMKHVVSGINLLEPQVMAIVNVTPDSFYAASRKYSVQSLDEHVATALRQGATIFDVGGYSTRPGAECVSLEEEWRRVELGASAVRNQTNLPISIDTFRAEIVARAAERFGEVIINDISAGEADGQMVGVVAANGLPYVAMHMRGTPQNMQSLTDYPRGVVCEVAEYLEQRLEWLGGQGVERVILDPGFGFAKTMEQNYQLLAGLERVVALGVPVLVGLSRKSMIYKLLGITPEESLAATSALNLFALERGATILRVHDVREAVDVVKLYKTMSL
jgi:dihydropteroate synthase